MINTSSVPRCFRKSAKVPSELARDRYGPAGIRSSTLKAMELILGGIVVAPSPRLSSRAPSTGCVKAQLCRSMSATTRRRDLRMAAAFRDEPLR